MCVSRRDRTRVFTCVGIHGVTCEPTRVFNRDIPSVSTRHLTRDLQRDEINGVPREEGYGVLRPLHGEDWPVDANEDRGAGYWGDWRDQDWVDTSDHVSEAICESVCDPSRDHGRDSQSAGSPWPRERPSEVLRVEVSVGECEDRYVFRREPGAELTLTARSTGTFTVSISVDPNSSDAVGGGGRQALRVSFAARLSVVPDRSSTPFGWPTAGWRQGLIPRVQR